MVPNSNLRCHVWPYTRFPCCHESLSFACVQDTSLPPGHVLVEKSESCNLSSQSKSDHLTDEDGHVYLTLVATPPPTKNTHPQY